MFIPGPNPAFISHSHKDLDVANEVKSILSELGCSGFLAHEDIHVSSDWQETILFALSGAHFFISLWSKNYIKSVWCLQEAGIAAANLDIVQIPLSIDGTVPKGFSAIKQAKKIRDLTPQISDIIPGLLSDTSGANEYAPYSEIVSYVIRARSFRDAESRMEMLSPFYLDLPENDAHELAEGILRNRQISDAHLCITQHIPLFVAMCGSKLTPSQRKKLQNLIQEQ